MSSQALWSDFKEQVRTRTDLVALIGEVVRLQPMQGGREFVGLCPFHDDHSPSMRVYPERSSFRCWACNTGGDCFDFVMLRENVPFREALELLAERARLELPKTSQRGNDATPSGGIGKPELYEVLRWAEDQFHETLWRAPEGARARDYLQKRGVSPETIRRFKLGYHPNSWEWLQQRARARFTKEQLLAARLIKEQTERGGFSDYFVDRVMFPIHDAQGKTVAFGGRELPDAPKSNMGKYWNSPESVLFSKSRLIYGLHHAREAIVKSGTAILMEGYMDCIMAQQSGVQNCVATLGTATTEQHVINLKRLAQRVVLVYDGDEAGQRASEKSLARFLAQEVDLRILTLTGDQDPADVMLSQGAEWFLQEAERAPEAWEFKLKRVIARHGLESVDAAHRVLEEMLELLGEVPIHLGTLPAGRWQMREDILLGRLFQRLQIPERNVRERLSEIRRQQAAAPVNMNREGVTRQSHSGFAQIQRLIKRPSVDDQIEAELLQIVLLYPETVNSIRGEITADEITNPALSELWKLCLSLSEQGVAPGFQQVLLRLEDSELKPLVVWLDEEGQRRGVTTDLLPHTLHAVQRRRLRGSSLQGTQDGPSGATRDRLNENAPAAGKTLLQQAMDKQRRLHERRNTGM